MCRSQAAGGRRCVQSERLEKLTTADLTPSTPGAPALDWADQEIATVWTEHDRPTVCAAIAKIETAAAHDRRTFEDMNTAAASTGATLHGAAFRLKSPASMARKITTKLDAAEAAGRRFEAADIAHSMTDVTRYTALSADHDDIVPTAKTTVAELTTRGWTVIEAEQSYVSGNPYKGLHLLMQHNDGQIAELQIQSQRSQNLKDRAHVLYEISRDNSRSWAERRKSAEDNKALYKGLPTPHGLNNLTQLGDCAVREKRYT
ncbi:hypothetical protein [Arthrobacter castelli]|uniref:hypothetical protein n=1 Tax=Arthrobacter castelli TaxID=271431 RepID=UPI00055D495D|nr:hypothetical protein [Arthrobacter castelli]